jgi:hypothetical protein
VPTMVLDFFCYTCLFHVKKKKNNRLYIVNINKIKTTYNGWVAQSHIYVMKRSFIILIVIARLQNKVVQMKNALIFFRQFSFIKASQCTLLLLLG